MTVTDPDPVYVTFLTGRSEITDPVTNGSPLEYFRTLLTANGYTVHFYGNGATEGSAADEAFTYDAAAKALNKK